MARETWANPAGEKKLEKYGVWVKVEPSEVSSLPDREADFELTDLAAGSPLEAEVSEEGALTDEEEKLLDELETTLPPAKGDLPQNGIPEEEPLLADTEEVESLAPIEAEIDASVDLEQVSGGELPDLGDSDVEVPLSDSLPHDESFDDLQALEDELASAQEEPAGSPSGESAQILARIEEELKSIRVDLTELKKELSGLKTTQAEAVSEGPSAGAESQTGFFDEEEDDTIALTGDELDNILNTAEVTEETAGGDGAPEEAQQVMADLQAQPAEEQVNILSFDTPLIEEDELVQGSKPPAQEPLTEERLDDLPAEAAEEVEDLPAELELGQDLGAPSEVKEGDLELDLEALPEIELEENAEDAPAVASDEAVDLDSLTDIELVPQAGEPLQVEAPAEDLLELGSLEEPAREEPVEITEEIGDLESLAEDAEAAVDLEPLPAEGDGLTDLDSLTAESGQSIPAAQGVDDLEIGELEAVGEEEISADSENEIHIDLEADEGAAEPAAEEAIELTLEDEPPARKEQADEEAMEVEDVPEVPEEIVPKDATGRPASSGIPEDLKDELRTVLKYMDSLLDALPDEKIKEFASSEYFAMYKKLFEELGLGE